MREELIDACARMRAGMATIRRIESAEPRIVDGLCALLIDAVHDGASVGFLAPLSRDTALKYWNSALAPPAHGLVLWIAESGGEVVGTVQLSLCAKENGRHRAELQKLLVLRSHRGKGIATALLLAADEFAAANGRTLLVLDTIAGSPAESVYRHLGWRKAGEVPEYAAMPDGELRATAYYYKRCPPEGRPRPGEYVAVWEFRVHADRRTEFERRYGPEGAWAGLFRRAEGYLGTELLHDRNDDLRYLTIDRWTTPDAYQSFHARFAEPYASLDRDCARLTAYEAALGEYDESPRR